MQDDALKATFNEDAERYHKYRPHYPQILFDTLVRTTGINAKSQLLEIGPGTGQATEVMAQYGCRITAVELGEHLAAKARAVLGGYPRVEVLTGAYEDTPLPATTYDLIYSATAFHWIRPEVRFTKTAQLLKPGGYMAIMYSEHVSDGKGDAFFFASEPIYKKYMWGDAASSAHDSFRLPSVSQLQPRPPIDTSLFSLESFSAFPVTIAYSAHDYAQLLNTYSPTIALPADRRKKFLAAIEDVINNDFGGSTERHFAMTLTIAKKR